MSSQHKPLHIFGGLVVLMLLCNSVNSQSNADSSVLPRACHDYTWYRKLKVGTAPFVNPRLLEEAFVGYKFRPDQITIDDNIVNDFASGRLMFGGLAPRSDSINAIELDRLPEFSNSLNNHESFTDWLTRQHNDASTNNLAIIGRQESIGNSHGEEIVCWTSKKWSPPQDLQKLVDNDSTIVEDNGS